MTVRAIWTRHGRRHAAGVAGILIVLALATATPTIAASESVRDAWTHAAEAQILVMIRMESAHFRPDVDYGYGYAGRAGLAARQRAAQAIARTHGLQLLSHWPMPALGLECYVMQVPQGVPVDTALAALERDGRAAWAQPMHAFSTRAYNDPLYVLQPSASAWQLHLLHEVASGRGALIALIDSGVEAEHPDLRGQLRSAIDTVDDRYAAEQHGTAVAGVIAARGGNGLGIVGVAPGAQLLVLRGCRERVAGKARCDTLSLAKALQLALDQRAQIVNLSVSGPRDRLLGALLDAALERDVIVVAAADAGADDGGFPASHAGVIAVTDERALLAHPFLAAAGTDVPTTLPGSRWGVVSGPSFAAAAVSGVAALLLELKPGANAPQIDALLRLRPLRVAGEAQSAPFQVDACRSVSLAAGRCACRCTDASASAAVRLAGPSAGEAAGPRRERGATTPPH